jgi:hypothetical protein
MRNLTHLYCDFCGSLEGIEALTGLTELCVQSEQENIVCLLPLRSLTRLQKLEVNVFQVSGADIALLSQLPVLCYLDLCLRNAKVPFHSLGDNDIGIRPADICCLLSKPHLSYLGFHPKQYLEEAKRLATACDSFLL